MALTGVKFRAYPTNEQKRILSQWMGCARFIYNAKCDEDAYFRKFLSGSLSLTGQRVPVDQTYSQFKSVETSWLKSCPSQILRNSAVIWHQAYERFFQGLSGRPVRKNKGCKDSVWLTKELFRFDQTVDPATGKIKTKLFIGTKSANIEYLSFEAHRSYCIPKSITVSRKNGCYFVSFNYEDGLQMKDPKKIIAQLARQGESALIEATDGLDRGVAIPLQASTGEAFDFTLQQKAAITREQRKVRRFQKRLSRKKTLDSNRRKQLKLKIAKSHEHIANIRKDFAHKTSRTLVDGKSQIFIAEDLKLKNMTRKPKAKQDEQGKYQRNGARAKAGLNGALLNSALGSMIIFLAYKAARQNKLTIKLPPHYSSQQCVECNHTHPDNRQTQDKFVCQNCGHTEQADLNAAQIMRKRGISTILSVASSEWKVNSDHTLTLAATNTRGTRGSARGGNRKTLRAKAPAQSHRSANLVVVAQLS